MSGTKPWHPSAEQLAAFGLGRLDESESAGIEGHVAGCPDCRATLEELPADTFLERLRASAHSAPTLPAVEPAGGQSEPLVPPELAAHPRYRVLQVLGSGGMGTVYKAEHRLMERVVALKVIRPDLTGDPGAAERFRREVKGAARLAHPNIVTAYDADQAGALHFLVMEFVEGCSLDQLVRRRGPLPVAEACDYARQAALGLQHAFERGMVHRDIKPHNLMRTPDGRVKILDFGLARFVRESVPPPGPGLEGAPAPAEAARALTLAGSVMGTPDYIAPEQIINPRTADIRADLYSLGCTLYFLLTGKVPFPEPTVFDKLMAHAERTPPPVIAVRTDVPPELTAALDRMLAKDPARRFRTPAEAARALEQAARAPAPPPAEQSAPPRRRWPGLAARAALLGGIALFLLLLFLHSEQEGNLHASLLTLYTVCAVAGGTLLACQFLLALTGLGHHHDFGGNGGHDHVGGHSPHESQESGHDASNSWFAGLLTFRTVVAALTFFGLAGRAAAAGGLEPLQALGVAVAAGAGALFLVAWLMRSLHALKAEGTLRMHRAVGHAGTVYVTIPGRRAGAGKVLLNIQNRTVECQAVTADEALATGTPVRVVAVLGPDTVEVVPASTLAASEGVSHA